MKEVRESMRYAFYISGKPSRPCVATRLCKFIRQSNNELIQQIKLVFADEQVSEETRSLLENNGIELFIFPYSSLNEESRKEKNSILSNKINEVLKEYHIDYCFSFGSHILSGPLLEDFKWRLINFHPAILPMFPGLKAIDQAEKHGNVFLVGNTAHFIDSGVDTGLIIMQSVVPINAFYESGRDYDVILDLQVEMLSKLMRIIGEGRLAIHNGKPIIQGAEYNCPQFFPDIDV